MTPSMALIAWAGGFIRSEVNGLIVSRVAIGQQIRRAGPLLGPGDN